MKEKAYLTVEPGTIPTKQLHGYLLGATSPRPIAFASTISPDGTPNLAPFSFFNVFSAKPPVLIFSPARRVRNNTTKHTLENILHTPEVVINVVPYGLVHQMNLASSEYPDGVNEFVKAGFSALPSDLIKPPRLAESPVQMECKVFEIKPLSDEGGAGNLIFCKVLKMHIDREVLNEKSQIDPHKIDLVGRMGGIWYSRTSGVSAFEVEKPPVNPGIGVDALPESVRLSTVLTGNDLGRLGNSAELPTQADTEAMWNALADRPSTQVDAHAQAKLMLESGDKERALKLLMASATFLLR